MVNLQRQRKKTEEKHELEEEIGGSENVRIPNYLVEGKAPSLWASPEANQGSSPQSLLLNGGKSERSSCSPELVEFVSFVGEIVTFIKYLSGQLQFIFLFEPLYRNRGADASLGSYQCPSFHHKINRRRLTYPIVVFVGARRILTSRKKI